MGAMESQVITGKELEKTIDRQAKPVATAPPEDLLTTVPKPLWSSWRYVMIALGILIELLAAGLLVFLIMIIPKIDLVAILFYCVPFIGFAGGIFVIYGSRWLK